MKLHNIFVLSAALQPESTIAVKRVLRFYSIPPLALSLLLVVAPLALGQQSAARAISFPTSIQWTKQKGVKKYRLQIAEDENFRGIFFDGRVSGERYTATGLPPGYYYWRTAPADFSTGQFSKPVRFFVSGGAVMPTTIRTKQGARTRVRIAAASQIH